MHGCSAELTSPLGPFPKQGDEQERGEGKKKDRIGRGKKKERTQIGNELNMWEGKKCGKTIKG